MGMMGAEGGRGACCMVLVTARVWTRAGTLVMAGVGGV